jgi:hypothetical protein
VDVRFGLATAGFFATGRTLAFFLFRDPDFDALVWRCVVFRAVTGSVVMVVSPLFGHDDSSLRSASKAREKIGKPLPRKSSDQTTGG